MTWVLFLRGKGHRRLAGASERFAPATATPLCLTAPVPVAIADIPSLTTALRMKS